MQPELPFRFRGQEWRLGRDALLMGIVNVTPDSFSDGGQFLDPSRAIAHGLALAEAGANLLDVGGESTRPGSAPVSEAEEIGRVVPVIRGLSSQTRVPVSVDTWKAGVAEAALNAGATIVNDVSGLHRDPAMAEVVRQYEAGCVLMHMRGTPATMQQLTVYDHLVEDLLDYFRATLDMAARQGIAAEQFMLDPGIGFAKTASQNLDLITGIARFRALGRPILVGPSRKSFIGALLGNAPPSERAWGTAGAVACCVLNGADVVRVHDVREMRDVTRVATAIREAMPRTDPVSR